MLTSWEHRREHFCAAPDHRRTDDISMFAQELRGLLRRPRRAQVQNIFDIDPRVHAH
jgi:hypothetical protein